MALLDALFDPRMLQGVGGLLNSVPYRLPQSAGFPGPLPQQVGETYANGQSGAMGGVPFQIAGQAPQTVDMSARSQTPPAAMTAAPPATQSPLYGQQQEPSISDRLSAFAHNPSGAKGIIPKLLDAVTGLTTGVRTDPQGIAQAQLNATYQALIKSGVPDATARAAALNPEILKTVAGAYFDTAPKLTESGQDPITGQKNFVWAQPSKMQITPATPAGQAGSQGGNLASFGDAVKNGVQGETLYDFLPAAMKNTVKAMIEGRMPPPSTVAMRSPATLAMINAANAIDPTFDATTWRSRNTFNTQLGSAQPNSVGGQKTLMTTALGHLGELADAAAALDNSSGGGIAPLGNAVNAVKNRISTTQAAKVNRLNETADRFAGEVGKLYSGSQGGGVGEREQTRSRFGAARTPEELIGALEASRDLIHSKLVALESQRDQVMGPAAKQIDFLGEKGRAALARVDAAIAKMKSGAPSAASSGPKVGDVQQGYRFKGGDPSKPESWEKQ